MRIGNGAWSQTQLDVYGEFLDAAWQIAELGIDIEPKSVRSSRISRTGSVLRWNDVDEGIWEVRGRRAALFLLEVDELGCIGPRRPACAGVLESDGRAARALGSINRDQIRDAILERGGATGPGRSPRPSVVMTSTRPTLMMAIVGFLPADSRMLATIEAIANSLTDDHGFVFRYLNADGLTGHEGTFGICTFWLAECLALVGRARTGRGALFERAAGCANDLGLLAEEISSVTREPLGNFPQAFTHIGLIHAALAIEGGMRPTGAA